MIRLTLCLLFMQLCLIVESTYPKEDRIVTLPGQPKVDFQQYGGYISVDDKTNRSFFYYFVEAENAPSLKPLVLWTGGELGCGGVTGAAFGGHGPFRVNGGQLFPNDHSFNKVANVLYLESPAGAGFSYSPDGSLNSSISDEHIARDELVFLQRWLEKFPVYKNRSLVLGGESYAGHTVPLLAELIYQTELKSNLEGIMLVSPSLDFASDSEAIPMYIWTHGLISDYTYKLLTKKPACDIVKYLEEYMMELTTGDKSGNKSPECIAVHKQLNFEFQSYQQNGLFDINNVKGDVCTANVSNNVVLNEPELSRCVVELARSYLDRDDVQKALHVKGPQVPCNSKIIKNYSKASLHRSTIPTLQLLLSLDIKLMIVSGDQDGRVPLTSTRRLMHKLSNELNFKTNVSYVHWYRDKSNKAPMGGWIQYYESPKLHFATVKGGDSCLRGNNTESALILLNKLVNDVIYYAYW